GEKSKTVPSAPARTAAQAAAGVVQRTNSGRGRAAGHGGGASVQARARGSVRLRRVVRCQDEVAARFLVAVPGAVDRVKQFSVRRQAAGENGDRVEHVAEGCCVAVVLREVAQHADGAESLRVAGLVGVGNTEDGAHTGKDAPVRQRK
ncbi:MAG TPA: hypothetical protein VEL76_10165, partial [Gemmataceae bacterium]|nr:hypothetical protein [Gemmataceae bacterium]